MYTGSLHSHKIFEFETWFGNRKHMHHVDVKLVLLKVCSFFL